MGYSQKPASCVNCSLYHKGAGFALPSGPKNSPILLVGEALGKMEAQKSIPFVGPSGMYLEKALRLVGLDRSLLRVANVVSCRPPDDKLSGAPWEADAIANCHQYLAPVLAEDHKVILTMGATSTRTLLGIGKDHKNPFKLNNWHSTLNVLEGYGDDKWVIPTYHPAYMLRGNQNLTSAVLFAFQLAKRATAGKLAKEPASLLLDPPIEVFREWARQYNPEIHWLAVDIETNGKLLKSEDEAENVPEQILRVNVSYNPGEGVTVPFYGQYVDVLRELLLSPGVKCFWNAPFDTSRLRDADCPVSGRILDFMDAWHILQSDMPRGLGFVAPFYSGYGPWKHLAGPNPAEYAAVDAVQTIRCAFGISKDLEKAGRWTTFIRHVYDLNTQVLQPATKMGLLIDKDRLEAFDKKLEASRGVLAEELRALYPPSILPLEGPWVNQPKNRDGAFTKEIEEDILTCLTCHKTDVKKKHKCTGTPELIDEVGLIPRWFVIEEFNPNSNIQIGNYIKYREFPVTTTTSGQISTDKLTLESLAKKDPFFKKLLDYRAIDKVKTTYVESTFERLKKSGDGRLHAQFLNKPSTLRLSCIEPNLTNIVGDKDKNNPATGFRSCIVAAPGCKLVEADFSAIEAVETGWFAGDPDYIRLARLGVHAYLTSHLIKKPADLSWSDADLGKYFSELKENFKAEYDKAKRVVHGTNYGLTPMGMAKRFPDLFNAATATKIQALYMDLCPKLKTWQDSVRGIAHRQHYLGGKDHPFGYQHWFWDVYSYGGRKKDQNGNWTDVWRHGNDYNRVVAYYPQSTAAGVLKEAALALNSMYDVSYTGPEDRTPFRALIHDSILLEVQIEYIDLVINALFNTMTAPILSQPCPEAWNMGQHLKVGVEIKVGKDWMSMEKVSANVGVAADLGAEEDEE